VRDRVALEDTGPRLDLVVGPLISIELRSDGDASS
jgi:hypothetical protein